MKRLFKKSLAAGIVAVMTLAATPLGGFLGLELPDLFDFKAEAVSYSGTCGDNLIWSLDTETGVLEISGTGEMTNWNNEELAYRPWSMYCDYIETVNIGSGVESIGNFAFAYFYNTKSFNVDSDNKYLSNDSYGVLFNSDKTKLINYPVGKVDTSYVIPDSVEIVGVCAFVGSDSLVDITIPEGVVYLKSFAFSDCINLTDIVIPNSVTTIGMQTFHGCINLKSVVIGDNVEYISMYAFFGCHSLTDIKIPDKVKGIDDMAFCYCKSLSSVVIPDKTTSIGEGAFSRCDSLRYIHIPVGITQLYEVTYETTAYICSTTDDCYAKTYADEKGIEFKICDGKHNSCEHSYTSKITKETSCKESGIRTYTCDKCGNSYTEEIAKMAHSHMVTSVPATCTQDGYIQEICSVCKDELNEPTVIPSPGHTSGEWEVVVEATIENEGFKVKRCTVCKEVVEEEVIPKNKQIRNGDVEVIVPGDMFEGNIELKVVAAKNDATFEVELNSGRLVAAYDISLLVNGVETQPNGKVSVCIYVGKSMFNRNCKVYHIDPVMGEREKISCEYDNGYIIFETDSFSLYAIIDGTPEVELVINEPSKTTINFGDTLILTLDEVEIPKGYTVKWFVEGEGVTMSVSDDDLECRVTSTANGNAVISVKLVDEDDEAVTGIDGEAITDEVIITSKAGFWQKLVSFFKNLFDINRVIY